MIPAHVIVTVELGSAALLHHVLGRFLGWCLCADHPGLQSRSFHSKGTEKSNKGPYCFFGSEQSTDLCLGDGIVLIVSYYKMEQMRLGGKENIIGLRENRAIGCELTG